VAVVILLTSVIRLNWAFGGDAIQAALRIVKEQLSNKVVPPAEGSVVFRGIPAGSAGNVVTLILVLVRFRPKRHRP
jgi:hypothetical protein